MWLWLNVKCNGWNFVNYFSVTKPEILMWDKQFTATEVKGPTTHDTRPTTHDPHPRPTLPRRLDSLNRNAPFPLNQGWRPKRAIFPPLILDGGGWSQFFSWSLQDCRSLGERNDLNQHIGQTVEIFSVSQMSVVNCGVRKSFNTQILHKT